MPAVIPVVAPVVFRQRKIVAAFRAAGATTAERATTGKALGLDEGMAFRLLRRHHILRDAGQQRVYLDDAGWEAHCSRRRRIAVTIVTTMLLLMAAGLVWILATR